MPQTPTYPTGETIDPTEHHDTHEGLADGSLATANNKLETFRSESFYDFVASGGVWTADNPAVDRTASMTSVVPYIGGKRVTASAVAARDFTASKDTYVDLGDDGGIDYNEVANKPASPALATNHIRLAIVTTGATTIAAQNNINQGQVDPAGPTVSSTILSVVDTIGNLIYNRTPTPGVIGYRQQLNDQGSITSEVDLTGLSVTVLIPAGRKIKISGICLIQSSVAADRAGLNIEEGGVTLQAIRTPLPNANTNFEMDGFTVESPSSGSHTYNLTALRATGTGTLSMEADTTFPAIIIVELI